MAGSVNKVILVGRLGKDPEIRRQQNGDPVASFSMATSDTWRDKASGERKEKTEWHSVVVFNKSLAEVAEKYLKKGSQVYVEGQLQTRKWQDKNGADRYTTEVVITAFRGGLTLLDKVDGDRAPPANSQDDYGQARGSSSTGASKKPASPAADLDDDIPF